MRTIEKTRPLNDYIPLNMGRFMSCYVYRKILFKNMKYRINILDVP